MSVADIIPTTPTPQLNAQLAHPVEKPYQVLELKNR